MAKQSQSLVQKATVLVNKVNQLVVSDHYRLANSVNDEISRMITKSIARADSKSVEELTKLKSSLPQTAPKGWVGRLRIDAISFIIWKAKIFHENGIDASLTAREKRIVAHASDRQKSLLRVYGVDL